MAIPKVTSATIASALLGTYLIQGGRVKDRIKARYTEVFNVPIDYDSTLSFWHRRFRIVRPSIPAWH